MAPSSSAALMRHVPWRFKISFGNFALFLLLLSLFTFLPSFLLQLRSNRLLLRKCRWLKQRPLVCAHGGDSSRALPNSLEALDLALKIKADCIEIDASQTQDGVLIALHDRDLQAVSQNDHIRVSELTINEITKVNIGLKIQNAYNDQPKILLLADALLHISRSVKQVIVDVKTSPSKTLAADILKLVNMTRCDNCIVWSKSDELVKELKYLAPNVQAGYIVMIDLLTGRTMSPLRMKAPEVVGAFHGVVSSKSLGSIHKAGKRVFAWTVNDRQTMEKMLSAGVDGIVTGDPALLQEVMQDREHECYAEGFSP